MKKYFVAVVLVVVSIIFSGLVGCGDRSGASLDDLNDDTSGIAEPIFEHAIEADQTNPAIDIPVDNDTQDSKKIICYDFSSQKVDTPIEKSGVQNDKIQAFNNFTAVFVPQTQEDILKSIRDKIDATIDATIDTTIDATNVNIEQALPNTGAQSYNEIQGINITGIDYTPQTREDIIKPVTDKFDALDDKIEKVCIETKLNAIRFNTESFILFDRNGKDLFIHEDMGVDDISTVEIVHVDDPICETIDLTSGCYILDEVEDEGGIADVNIRLNQELDVSRSTDDIEIKGPIDFENIIKKLGAMRLLPVQPSPNAEMEGPLSPSPELSY